MMYALIRRRRLCRWFAPLLLPGAFAWAGQGNEAASQALPDIELTLVYPQYPDTRAAYERVVSEVTILVREGDFRRLHIGARAVTGKEYAEHSWQRIPDPAGGFVDVDYDPQTRELRHDGKLLKRL